MSSPRRSKPDLGHVVKARHYRDAETLATSVRSGAEPRLLPEVRVPGVVSPRLRSARNQHG